MCNVFRKLSRYLTVHDEQDLAIIEMYVLSLYDMFSPVTSVDEAKFDMFPRKQHSFDTNPPTRASLIENTTRASYTHLMLFVLQEHH